MAWQNGESNGASQWPTWTTRRNWAKNNYLKYDFQWQLEKFLVMLANLTALADLLEEAGGEQLLTKREQKEWREMYEQFRPTRPVGRPRSEEE